MPDDPHVHPDGSFMLAAEKQVDTLIKGAKLHKIQLRILTAVCALILAVCGVLGYVVKTQYDTTQELRQDSVNACQAGNEFKVRQNAIWVYFIGQLLKNDKKPKDLAEGANILVRIEHINAPRNCTAQYSIRGASVFNATKP